MSKQVELFEFLCELIDIQLKKYVSLALLGIGPDARLNAHLVFAEVNELLSLTEQLLVTIENRSVHDDQFVSIYHQVRFYIEQEHSRAYAGWLLDDNNIHSPSLARVGAQLEQLLELGRSAAINCALPAKSVTEVQKQCAHDSAEIGFFILDLARKIRDNPNMYLDDRIPMHARQILKRNASTRYSKEDYSKPIDEMHAQLAHFLQDSQLQKSNTVLLKEDAKLVEVAHRRRWNMLLDRYKEVVPDSKLFDPLHPWYKIGFHASTEEKIKPKFSLAHSTLFGGAFVVGIVAVSMLTFYFINQQNEGHNPNTFTI